MPSTPSHTVFTPSSKPFRQIYATNAPEKRKETFKGKRSIAMQSLLSDSELKRHFETMDSRQWTYYVLGLDWLRPAPGLTTVVLPGEEAAQTSKAVLQLNPAIVWPNSNRFLVHVLHPRAAHIHVEDLKLHAASCTYRFPYCR